MLLLATVVTVNVVGVWQIAILRRGVTEERRHLLQMEADAAAGVVDRALVSVRADLAFVAASAALRELEALRPVPQDLTEKGSLGATGQSLLLFLRGHPEVDRVHLEAKDGAVLFVAGRPRGIAGLWVPADDAAESRSSDARSSIAIAVPVRSAAGGAPFHLRALADIDGLASFWEGPGDPARLSCRLDDAMGRTLVAPAIEADASEAEVSATIGADGWPQAPWWLRCRFGPQREVALLGPVLSRYRTTVVLDLVILGLAIVLGAFALREARRLRRSEARAEVEAASREFERALFHAERLSTVGRLTAGIAHEINNPLEGMSNYLRLAEDRLESEDTASARKYLASVREGLERVAGIARGVLDHSRPHAESPGPALVSDVVTRAADFVRSRPEFAGVRFDLDLQDGETQVAADPVALGQVFLNLMLNACEEQRGGGEVRVATRREASDVVVEVADRGPGIREDHKERLFRPFTSSKGSSGLGLFICSEILRRHRGRIEALDRPGGGALFIVRVPMAERA